MPRPPARPIRVLHIASGDAWGGAERVISLLVAGSAKRAEVEIECLLLNEGRLAKELRELGVDVDVVDETQRSFAQLCGDIRRHIRDRGFDVHHVHRYKELAAILLATLPGRSRAAITVHGLEPRKQLSWQLLTRAWSLLYAAVLRGVRIVAVSPELERRLRRALPGGRIRRIPNPLPPGPGQAPAPDLRERFGWKSDAKLVGFVGRLETVKGPDRLVEIARLCDATTHFVLVGGGSMEAELRAAIADHGLLDRVRCAGELPDAAARIGELDVLAMTSRHEGLPMVLLEAAASDTPVISFEVGGVSDLVDGSPGARLISDGDLDGFAAALDRMIEDPDLPQHATAWGAGVRSRMQLPSVIDAYLDLYREIRGD